VVAELAAEFRSEQDYLGECNKNRLLAAAECFAHLWWSKLNKFLLYKFGFASIQEIGPEASKVWWVPATFTC
jgi:hypothetical protein